MQCVQWKDQYVMWIACHLIFCTLQNVHFTTCALCTMRTLHVIMTTSSFPYKYLWAHMQTFFEAYQQFSLAIFKLELSYNN